MHQANGLIASCASRRWCRDTPCSWRRASACRHCYQPAMQRARSMRAMQSALHTTGTSLLPENGTLWGALNSSSTSAGRPRKGKRPWFGQFVAYGERAQTHLVQEGKLLVENAVLNSLGLERPTGYSSARNPDAFTIGAHRAVSSATRLASSSGVLPTGSRPSSSKRGPISGDLIADTIARERRSTVDCGVPARV